MKKFHDASSLLNACVLCSFEPAVFWEKASIGDVAVGLVLLEKTTPSPM